ncbi:DUF1287 domain-containing protein, partial [Vibrio cholerae O1]|nr:DUF1287 domain-containing protein [Vibrio cholerae O1]
MWSLYWCRNVKLTGSPPCSGRWPTVRFWRLDNGLAHIGVVSDGFARDGTPLVIHNIGAGAQEEDVL